MYIDKALAKEIIRLLENYQEVIDNLKELADDMAMDEYELKQGEHWITLPNKSRVVINAEKKIICGLEGKYNGLTIEELKEVQKGESEGYTTSLERKKKIESVKIDFDRDNILPNTIITTIISLNTMKGLMN
jgi:hypothetical protein